MTVDVLSEGMNMCEILQTNVLLEKFPPSWVEYRNKLKHKKKDLTLQEARETSKKGPTNQNQWDRKEKNCINKGGNKI